ncbi:MAG: undecaprenyl-diphosphatase [Chloroflexota bacterium]|nr:undecaprenyl-diphosphatase [Chloroflexota bacterium]
MEDLPTPVAAPVEAIEKTAEAVEEVKEKTEQELTGAALEIAADEPAVKKQALVRMGGIRALDASVFLFINHLPHTRETDYAVGGLSDLGKGVGWVAVAVVAGLADGRRGWRAGVATVAGMLASTGLTQGPIKKYFMRRRPFEDVVEDIVVGKRAPDSSFPSGHTAGSFAAATVMSHFYPRWRIPLYAAAVGVGFSRTYLGQHYPSDVAGGALIGTSVGLTAAQLGSRLGRK